MGFRCLKCKKDFGKNEKEFKAHLLICTGLSIDDIKNAVEENSEDITKDIMTCSVVRDVLKEIMEK